MGADFDELIENGAINEVEFDAETMADKVYDSLDIGNLFRDFGTRAPKKGNYRYDNDKIERLKEINQELLKPDFEDEKK